MTVILSALVKPSLLTHTWSKWLYALVFLSIDMALFEYSMSYGPGIMVVAITVQARGGLHSAIWFKNVVILNRYVLVMTLSSQVITQQVVSFLNVGRIACLD
jgi:hypothetical protein